MSYKTYEVTIYSSGNKQWRLNSKLHREDGPAVERANRDKHWYLNGKRHREDGPAIECVDGDKYWYLDDKLLSEEEFSKQINSQSCDGIEIIVDGRKYKLVEAE